MAPWKDVCGRLHQQTVTSSNEHIEEMSTESNKYSGETIATDTDEGSEGPRFGRQCLPFPARSSFRSAHHHTVIEKREWDAVVKDWETIIVEKLDVIASR
jgi:hypothetical protein